MGDIPIILEYHRNFFPILVSEFFHLQDGVIHSGNGENRPFATIPPGVVFPENSVTKILTPSARVFFPIITVFSPFPRVIPPAERKNTFAVLRVDILSLAD